MILCLLTEAIFFCVTALSPPLLLVETLSTTQGQPGLRVFNHAPTEQAERGKRLYIFNVVQPTMEGNLFSFEEPSGITLRNERSYYTVENVKVTDEVLLQVTYFAREGGNSITLGSLSTQINVFGKCAMH